MKNILFYFQGRSIGGAQLLFSRLAQWFTMNTDYDVFICDYEDGFMAKSLSGNKKVILIPYTGKRISLSSKSITTCVLFAEHSYNLKELFIFDKSCRFFLWAVNPRDLLFEFSILDMPIISFGKRQKIGNLLKSLVDNKGLFFMDYPNYISAAKFYDFNCDNVEYMQIMVPDADFLPEYRPQDLNNKNTVKIAWLGRLDGDKYNCVEMMFKELYDYNKCNRIEIYIIGGGNKIEKLKALAVQLNLNVHFLGVMFGAKLDDYLINQIDIGFAQGTAALDFAKKGKPVILSDIYHGNYPAHNVKYNLLYQTEKYGVGELYTDRTSRNFYFSDALDYIIKNYNQCAESCYNYASNNFRLDVVAKKFLRKIENFEQDELNNQHNALDMLYREYNSGLDSYIRILKKFRRKYIRF